MNLLQQIEQTYNFQYPKLYHQLYGGWYAQLGTIWSSLVRT